MTGKPDGVNVARPAWSGGKKARSYPSLPEGDNGFVSVKRTAVPRDAVKPGGGIHFHGAR